MPSPATKSTRRHAPTFALRWALVVAALLSPVLDDSSLEAPSRHQGAVQTPGEYDVKAGFLYNFALFVRWPESAFDGPESPVIFAVVGSDPFGRALDRALEGKRAHDRPLAVRRFSRIQDLGHCHVLFVPNSRPEDLRRVLDRVADRTILVVGEQSDFAIQGGVINFFMERNRVRFEINPEEARGRDLRISSQLLNLARIVGRQGNQ